MYSDLKMNNPFFRFAAFSLILAAAIFTKAVYAEGILDTVNAAASAATGGWMSRALDLAKTLFFGLAALEFTWSAIQLTLKKSELTDIAVSTMFKVMNLAFFSMILIKAPEWIPAIMDSFKQAGSEVGGAPMLTPSAVISRGIDLAGDLVTKGQELNGEQNGLLDAGSYLLSAIVIGLSGLMVILGFAVVAIQLFVALVESYIIIGGGALMLGFLGSRWTSNFGEKYFSYAVSVGIKLFTMYLLVGLGDTFFQAMQDNLNQLVSSGKEISFGDWLGMGGTSVIYGGLGYMVPGIASSMLNGSAALSMANLGAAGGALAAAPVAGALAAGAAGSQMAGALAGLSKTKSAAGGIGGSLPGGVGGGSLGGLNKSGQTGNKASSSSNFGSGSDKSAANGFANNNSDNGGLTARNMGAGGGRSSGDRTLSDKLKDKTKELQYQADRRKPGLVHDGNQGSGISVRMGHHED